jgi:S1-C subfamily serine protease
LVARRNEVQICRANGVHLVAGWNGENTIQTITSDVKKLVVGATFKIQTRERGSGQCVLVKGGFIITAAHCVDWDCSGNMAMGEFYLSKIKTGSGDLTASTFAVEPISDIAVLGSPDNQTFCHESATFDEFCEGVAPVKLLRRIPKPFKPFPVWIRTHIKTWVDGTATYFGGCATFAYKTDCEIQCGTSGGPIVNHAGELVGVVSHATNTCFQGKYTAAAGLLSLALPAWIIARAI